MAQARLLTQNQQCLHSGALWLHPEGSGHWEECRTATGLHWGSTKPMHNRFVVQAAPSPAWEAATAPAVAQRWTPCPAQAPVRNSSPPPAARVQAGTINELQPICTAACLIGLQASRSNTSCTQQGTCSYEPFQRGPTQGPGTGSGGS